MSKVTQAAAEIWTDVCARDLIYKEWRKRSAAIIAKHFKPEELAKALLCGEKRFGVRPETAANAMYWHSGCCRSDDEVLSTLTAAITAWMNEEV